jgi:uncharacterized protein YndB with AHSA1/START domain
MMINTSVIDTEMVAPVIRSVNVPLSPETAFRLFTENIHHWWPLVTHSVYGDEAQRCTLEGWVGGRFYETHQDGREAEWGRVLIWEPPQRLVFSFYPGRAPDRATDVEIIFDGEGKATRLTLTHSGWERLDSGLQAYRDRYNTGWTFVLGKYVDFVRD